MGRTSTFLDIYAERDLKEGTFTEKEIQEIIDQFVMKLRMIKFARTPEYNSIFAGDPTWVTESIGGVASEELQKQIMEKQSSDIDGVSGATETSNAVKAALEDAIAQASGSENKEKTALKDGTYEESAASFGVMGLMKGEVTIKDNKITDIKITEESDSLNSKDFVSRIVSPTFLYNIS